MSMTELRSDWLIGYYASGRDKFSAKPISINNFSSKRVDSKGLYGRWRLRVMGSWLWLAWMSLRLACMAWIALKLCTSQFQNRPSPPGQSPGIWLALNSVQRGIWPKTRPARWGIWLSCLNVCQRSEAKGFRNSLIQHVSLVHGSLLLSIPRGFCCCCRFI